MTNDNRNVQTTPSNPALENLGRLVGKWQVELAFPSDPCNMMHEFDLTYQRVGLATEEACHCRPEPPNHPAVKPIT